MVARSLSPALGRTQTPVSRLPSPEKRFWMLRRLAARRVHCLGPRLARARPCAAAAALLPLVLMASSCVTWQQTPLDHPLPPTIRVQLVDHTRVRLWHAALQGDSAVTGVAADGSSRFIPLRSVERVAVHRIHAPRTITLIGVVFPIVLIWYFAQGVNGT